MSARDPLQIAGIKGLVARLVNLSIAFTIAYHLPDTRTVLTAGLVGFCGYGLSLVMFVIALRHLGTARTVRISRRRRLSAPPSRWSC